MTKLSPDRPTKAELAPRFTELVQKSVTDEIDLEESFETLLSEAIAKRVSDIHLDPWPDGYCLRMRVDGTLHDVCEISAELGERFLNHFKVMAQLDPVPALKPMEGWVEHEGGDREVNLRVSCVPTVSGDKLSLRILDPKRVQSKLTDLGLNDSQSELIQEWLGEIQGMFLVAGAVGTGKTTTLYSLLRELRDRERSTVTIEDPVEYRINGVTQIQVSEKRDFDFATGLKAILRIDPDYVMLGEMRDAASTEAAWDAAATGKVLLSTLHSKDAAGVVTALRNYGLKDFEIASLLELVVAQRLVRTLCDKCKKEKAPESIDRKWFESLDRELPEKVHYAEGCEDCGGIGYRGRTGVFEVWRVEDAHKEYILSQPDEISLRAKLREWGVPGLIDAAMDLLESGETSPKEIRMVGGFLT